MYSVVLSYAFLDYIYQNVIFPQINHNSLFYISNCKITTVGLYFLKYNTLDKKQVNSFVFNFIIVF